MLSLDLSLTSIAFFFGLFVNQHPRLANKITGFIKFCSVYKYGSVFKNNKSRNTSFVKSCNGAMSQKFLM